MKNPLAGEKVLRSEFPTSMTATLAVVLFSTLTYSADPFAVDDLEWGDDGPPPEFYALNAPPAFETRTKGIKGAIQAIEEICGECEHYWVSSEYAYKLECVLLFRSGGGFPGGSVYSNWSIKRVSPGSKNTVLTLVMGDGKSWDAVPSYRIWTTLLKLSYMADELEEQGRLIE